MTRNDWLTGYDPVAMVEWVRVLYGPFGDQEDVRRRDRRLALFSCAVYERFVNQHPAWVRRGYGLDVTDHYKRIERALMDWDVADEAERFASREQLRATRRFVVDETPDPTVSEVTRAEKAEILWDIFGEDPRDPIHLGPLAGNCCLSPNGRLVKLVDGDVPERMVFDVVDGPGGSSRTVPVPARARPSAQDVRSEVPDAGRARRRAGRLRALRVRGVPGPCRRPAGRGRRFHAPCRPASARRAA